MCQGRAVLTVTSLLFAIASCPSFALGGELFGSDAFTTAIGTIDRDTAEWTQIGYSGALITGLAYDSNHDILYGISPNTDALYEVDQHTGGARVVGAPGNLGYGNANGLAYDPIDDILYGTDNNTNMLFTIDPDTGVGTGVAQIGGFTEIEGLGFEPDQGILYGITQLQRRIVEIDVRTGEAQAVSDQLPDLVWRGLDWDPEYRVLFASAVVIFDNARIYSFDPVNGRLDYRGDTVGIEAVQGLGFVPEPSAILLCLTVIPFALGRHRR